LEAQEFRKSQLDNFGHDLNHFSIKWDWGESDVDETVVPILFDIGRAGSEPRPF